MAYTIFGDHISGAIFDLDGTLLDSVGVWREIDVKFFSKRGINVDLDDFFKHISSMNFSAAADYVIKHFNLDETPEQVIHEWFSSAVEAYSTTLKLKPSASEYLALLRENGVKIALATASDVKLYEPALKNTGIDVYFDAIASTAETKRGKGFPDVYELASDRLGLSPSECVVFEDIPAGISGAKLGGFRTCAVFDEHSERFWTAMRSDSDYAIVSYKELI